MVVLSKDGSDHTTSTAPMSPCSVNEKEEIELPTQIPKMGDFEEEEKVPTTRWGSMSALSPSTHNATQATNCPLSSACIEKKVKNSPDILKVTTKQQPSKIRKTQSLLSPSAMSNKSRWSRSDRSTTTSTNEEWTLEPRKPIRRRGDSLGDDEWADLAFEVFEEVGPRPTKTMRRSMSSVDARRTTMEPLNSSFSKRRNAAPSHSATRSNGSLRAGQPQLRSDEAVGRQEHLLHKEKEEETLRRQLAELYGQVDALTNSAGIVEARSTGTNISNTEPRIGGVRRSNNVSRHQALSLSAIDEDAMNASEGILGGNASWKGMHTIRPSANSITKSSGSVVSINSASSGSMGIASIIDTSNHSTKSTGMASVYSKTLTPEQQAKLLQLQKMASTSTSSHSGRKTAMDISNLGRTQDAALSLIRQGGQSTLPINDFSSIRSDVSEISHNGINMSADYIDLSGRFSSASDISSISNRISARDSIGQQLPLSPRPRRSDVLQPRLQSQPAKTIMPFGYKAKSTNGLFGSTRTPPSSAPRIQDESIESIRRGANTRWDKTLEAKPVSDSIQTCLEKAPVQGEQLARMKALLLGQNPISPSSDEKRAMSRRHGSTPVLGGLAKHRSSRPDMESKNPSRKILSGSSLLPETSCRWLPSPIPPNRRWDADITSSSSPLTAACLSGRRSTNALAQSEHSRWTSKSRMATKPNTRSLSTGMTSPETEIGQNLERRSPTRRQNAGAKNEHSPSRWNSNSPAGMPQRNSSGARLWMIGCPTSSETAAPNDEKCSTLKARGQDPLIQSEHGPSRWRSTNNVMSIHRSGSGLMTQVTGCPISPEAVALSALMLRREGEKHMTRGPGSSTRMNKPQASLGQLKRSRLSLANMKQSVAEDIGSGGMNSTWSTSTNNRATVALSLSNWEIQGASPTTNDTQNIFASIISSSNKKSTNSHSSSKLMSPTKATMDLDEKVMSTISRGKKSDRFQTIPVVEATTFAPRNKSDLRQIVLGTGSGSMHRAQSIGGIMKQF